MPSSAHPVKQEQSNRTEGREVEWQLECNDLGVVRRWLADHHEIDGLILEPRAPQQIFDTYLDTDDWRIHRAGFALRIRSVSGNSEATLKSLHCAGEGAVDRRELSEPLEDAPGESLAQSIGPVGARVTAVRGTHALLPLFEVRTARQRVAVRGLDVPAQLGEIALDESIISRPHGEPQTSIQRVEVEALTEVHEPLQSLVNTLRGACALDAAPDTKYARGLRSVGLAPGATAEFAPTSVDASMPMSQVAYANLRRYWSAWHVHEPGARLGDHPEELHDLRVAGRRLDAILRQFETWLPTPLLRIRPTLKKILSTLGEVRDLDVALVDLDTFSNRLPEAERNGVEPLRWQLAVQRRRARARMLRLLDSASVRKTLQKLTAALAAPAPRARQPRRKLAIDAAPDMIRQRYRKLRKAADRLTPDSPMESYHRVRGQVKKMRYALEAVAVIYGKSADELLRALCRWQDGLGVQQDADVASRRLTALAGLSSKDLSPASLFLMGRLAEQYSAAASRARKGYAKAYRKVRARWKRLRVLLGSIEPGSG